MTISPYEAACLYTLANQTQWIYCWREGGTHSAEEGQNPLAEHVPRTESAGGLCPPGQSMPVDCVPPDRIR